MCVRMGVFLHMKNGVSLGIVRKVWWENLGGGERVNFCKVQRENNHLDLNPPV